MTKTHYIAMVLLAAVLAGCSKKPNPDEPGGPQGPRTVTLNASLEDAKAAVDPDGKMTWQEGDRIAVLCGDGSVVPFTLASGAGSAFATFTGEVGALTTVVKAGYPYEAGVWSGETGSDLVFTPSDAGVPWGGNSKVFAVMMGDIMDDAVRFTHQGGVLHFAIEDIPAGMSKFAFTTSGEVVYGSNAFTLNFTPAAGMMDFYIPVSAGTIPSYTISLCDAAGNAILSKTKSSSTPMSRCELKDLTPLKVVEANKLRILSYNVENGMAADMDNNYDNFVAWINAQAPDILVLCEAKNNEIVLNTLASRWEHAYTAIVNRDSYPVVVTSSRPMSTVKVVSNGTYVSHGAVYVSVAGLNLVGLHLRPTQDKGTEQPNKYEYYGAQRVVELNYILGQTILSDTYSSRTDWIFLGDYNMMAYSERNAVSPVGGAAYNYPDYEGKRSVAYDVYDNMCATGLTDVLYQFNGGIFQPTMGHGRSRLDYIFASPSLYSRIRSATVVRGGFPGNYKGTANPSDHMPLLIDMSDYAFRVLDGQNRLADWGEEILFDED